MRLSADINAHHRIYPFTLGISADPGTTRLPRRLSRYFEGTTNREGRQEILSYLFARLADGDLGELLDQAREFAAGARAFRRRPVRSWQVGDPCYINGEGHGCLFFIQAVDGTGLIVNGCRESAYKAYRPTYLELFRHRVLDRWNLRIYEETANRFTPKQLREQNGKVQREVREAQRQVLALRASIEHLNACLSS